MISNIKGWYIIRWETNQENWKMSTPRNKTEIEHFLGLTHFSSYYQSIYNDLIESFIKPHKKNTEFNRTKKLQSCLKHWKKYKQKTVIKRLWSKQRSNINHQSRKLTAIEIKDLNIKKEELECGSRKWCKLLEKEIFVNVGRKAVRIHI